MKKPFIFLLLGVFCTHLAIAKESVTNETSVLTGCAAKIANIENELSIAQTQGHDGKVKGLKRALRAAKKCDDATLRAEREEEVREAADKVSEREEELQEEMREGDADDIAKARRKLAEAQADLTEAKAELSH